MRLFLSTPALKSEAFSCKSTPLHAHIISAPPGGRPLNNIQDNKELTPRLHQEETAHRVAALSTRMPHSLLLFEKAELDSTETPWVGGGAKIYIL
jgi:hypothetical protein